MEKEINMIFEIEEKANTIINRANTEKASLYIEFEKELAQMKKNIASDSSEKLKVLQKKADENSEKEKQVLIANSEKHLKELEHIDKKKHTTMVHRVFDNIINL